MRRMEAPPLADTGQEEAALSARQQSALQAGLHDLPIPLISADFNQRLIGALSDRDMRPWYAQLGTRLKWMLPGVLVGCVITLAVAAAQNFNQQARATQSVSRAIAPAAAPSLSARYVVYPPMGQHADAAARNKEAPHESR